MSIAVETVTVRRRAAIHVWAALGALFLALQIYVFARWIFSPEFVATPVGPDPIPASIRSTITNYQVIGVSLGVVALLWFVVGMVRTRAINTWRLLMLGWLSAYWLDPWLSFLRPMFTYNAYVFNRGCWCTFMPGWQSPAGARIAEPLLANIPFYFYNFTLTSALAWWAMRAVKRRVPNASAVVLTLVGCAAIWATMSVFDITATRFMGFDAWPIAYRSVTVWAGQSFQFPLYEFVAFPAIFVVCAWVALTQDKAGLTVIERGVELVPGGWQRTGLRISAFIALCNVCNLGYTTAHGVAAVFADPYPASFPSWLSDQQCGPLTGHECTQGASPVAVTATP